MNQRKVRAYDKEFKLNAVNFYLKSGKTYKEVSDELGVPTGTLVTWLKSNKKDGAESFPGKGNIKESDIEIVQLRKRLCIAEEERDILKKALGIFSLARK
jgi:transposase